MFKHTLVAAPAVLAFTIATAAPAATKAPSEAAVARCAAESVKSVRVPGGKIFAEKIFTGNVGAHEATNIAFVKNKHLTGLEIKYTPASRHVSIYAMHDRSHAGRIDESAGMFIKGTIEGNAFKNRASGQVNDGPDLSPYARSFKTWSTNAAHTVEHRFTTCLRLTNTGRPFTAATSAGAMPQMK